MNTLRLPPVVYVGFEHILDDATKIQHFFKLFKTPPVDQQVFTPLLLVNNYSRSGEVAESFGLFVKEGQLFEVHGSECSVWDFDGQWEPEPTTVQALLHRLDHGRLGQDPDHPFHEPLRQVLAHVLLWENMSLPYQQLPSSPPRKI